MISIIYIIVYCWFNYPLVVSYDFSSVLIQDLRLSYFVFLSRKPESKGVTLLKWFKSSPKKKDSEETSNDATTHDSLSEEPPAKKPKIE